MPTTTIDPSEPIAYTVCPVGAERWESWPCRFLHLALVSRLNRRAALGGAR